MNLGWPELLLIFGIVVLIFGAKRLPEFGRSIGEAIQEFQRSLKGNSAKDSDHDELPPKQDSQ